MNLCRFTVFLNGDDIECTIEDGDKYNTKGGGRDKEVLVLRSRKWITKRSDGSATELYKGVWDTIHGVLK